MTNNIANIGGGTQIKQSYIDLFTEDKTEENHEKAQEIIESLLEWSKKGGEGN